MARRMRFFSDNAAAVCPEVMSVLAEANRPNISDDVDSCSGRVDECGVPHFDAGGTKLLLVEGEGAKVSPADVIDPAAIGALAAALERL